MSEALPLKYRPKKLEDVAGNKSAVEAIKIFLDRDDRPRAYLFAGPSGCGKTTLVRIMSRELGCKKSDFFEYNASNTRGIDTARSIASNCIYAPLGKGVKVYLLDEAHMLTREAQNSLLKTLEDGPKHAYFMLATTNPEKLIKAIHTRCTTIQVSPLTTKDMKKLVKSVCEKEEVELPDEIIKELVRASDGSPREALKLLDTVIDIEDDELALQTIASFSASEATVKEICEILLEKSDKKKRWARLATLLRTLESESESLRRGVLGYLGAVLMNRGDMRIADKMEFFKENFFDSGKSGMIQACYYAIFLEE